MTAISAPDRASSRSAVYPPFQDPRTVILSEPRIWMVKGMLEALLQIVELEHDGHPVAVNGFRLRNLQDWVVVFGGRITPSILLDGLAVGCNVSCRFCYIKGNPPDWNPRPMPRKYDDG